MVALVVSYNFPRSNIVIIDFFLCLIDDFLQLISIYNRTLSLNQFHNLNYNSIQYPPSSPLITNIYLLYFTMTM